MPYPLRTPIQKGAGTMAGNVTFLGTYEIPGGAFDEWRAAIVDMTDFVKAHVPRLISFNHYVNEELTEAVTIYVHPNAASLEQHLEVAATRISKGVQLVKVKRIDLYGDPGAAVLERLRRISAMSTGFPVTVKAHVYGS